MSNSKLSFSKLRDISESIRDGDGDEFVKYANSIKGDDIHDKFCNFLKQWSSDVSEEIKLNLDGKSITISLNYIISVFEKSEKNQLTFINDDITIILGIPKNFSEINNNSIIYDLIYEIKIFNNSLNLLNLSNLEKISIIDNLPSNIYNKLLNLINNSKFNNVSLSNTKPLKNIKFNFLSNNPRDFMINLLSSYSDDYFRNVIFDLSGSIDASFLRDSTPLDIEFYSRRLSECRNLLK